MADKKSGAESGPRVSRLTKNGLRVAEDAVDLIARTPIVRLGKLTAPGGASIYAKCEFMNPGGSVKDRTALGMVQAAERAGELSPGNIIVEATSGNTGISLAMIAAVRGYKCILVMPEDMSMERRYILRSYGAQIELTPAQRGMAGAVERAREIARENPGALMPSQFENPANPTAHAETTAREIIEQMDGQIAAFVAGVGTGGTLSGVARVLKKELPEAKIFAVEPAASPVLSGGRPGLHGIQGLGAGFIPKVLDRDLIDEVITVSDVVAEKAAQRLAQSAGLLVGPSAGANVHAALSVAERFGAGNIVTVLCDSGERYLF